MSLLSWKRLPPAMGGFRLRAYGEAGVFLLRVEPRRNPCLGDRVTLSFFPARVNPHRLAFGGHRIGEFDTIRAAQEAALRMNGEEAPVTPPPPET